MTGEEDLCNNTGVSVKKEEVLSEDDIDVGDTSAFVENSDNCNVTVKSDISITKHEPIWGDCDVQGIGMTKEEPFCNGGEVIGEFPITEEAPKYSDILKQEQVEPEFVCMESDEMKTWDEANKMSFDPLTGASDSQQSTSADFPPSASGSDSQQAASLHWNKNETLALITLVKNNYEALSTQVKKNIWCRIANDLANTIGFKISWQQCDTKWKGLKKMYKNIKDHNGKSGNDRKTWEYFEVMDDVIGDKPEVSPVATCSSSRGMSSADKSKTASDDEEFESSFTTKRRKLNNDSAGERRHRERMERQDKFLQLFEEYLKKK